jgi:flavin-binding protein dodecin
MTVARISEISSISEKSFEDAIVQGVARANKTLKNVKGAWVKEQEVTIDNGKVTGYKVILKVTFVLNDYRRLLCYRIGPPAVVERPAPNITSGAKPRIGDRHLEIGALILVQADFPVDARPFFHLGLDECAERFGRHRPYLKALRLHGSSNVRCIQYAHDLLVQARNDRLRRFCGRDEPVPGVGFVSRHACL